MAELTHPTLLFPYGFNERDAFEIEQKGYYDHAIIQLPSGARVRVCFYDPVRLSQDLEAAQESGEVCIAQPGMIVIPNVTREYMERAVKQLYEEGYFNTLTPLST